MHHGPEDISLLSWSYCPTHRNVKTQAIELAKELGSIGKGHPENSWRMLFDPCYPSPIVSMGSIQQENGQRRGISVPMELVSKQRIKN